MSIDVQIRGLERAIRNLRDYQTDAINAVKRVVTETAVGIEGDAVSLAPVDTGNLKNSIHTKYKNDGLSAEIGTPVEYAAHVEFGTRRQSAQPYLMPAHEANKGDYLNKLRDALGGN